MLVNDERTRTFLALSAAAASGAEQQQRQQGGPANAGAAGGSPLLRAIEAASRAFQLNGLPRFYEVPRPHISVAWLLGDCEQQLDAALAGGGALGEATRALAAVRWQAQVRWGLQLAVARQGPLWSAMLRRGSCQWPLVWLATLDHRLRLVPLLCPQVDKIYCKAGQRTFVVWER